ncbi:hypothetical protein [Streptomyces sp. NRRL B-24484]|uniref:hypothetical protein n=1 Tax=Streptomyces sp. NRRL B-24484 TaxID=1463833 RepID=UPI0004C04600|nr:hypothetical protein [Streptomyces sp. NRRL B-24484]
MMPAPLAPYDEHVLLKADWVFAVLRTLDLAGTCARHPRAVAAVAALREAAAGQDRSDRWLVPGEHAYFAAYYADAGELLELDEEDPATYEHPAVLAEHLICAAVRDQAPRTMAAIDAVHNAEALLVAQHPEQP